MRFDLLHEHDRFIPGWHCRPDPSSMRVEYTPPEWSPVSRLVTLIRRLLRNILLISAKSHPTALQIGPPAPWAGSRFPAMANRGWSPRGVSNTQSSATWLMT